MGMNGKHSAKHPGKVFLSVEDIADRLTEYQVFDTRYSLDGKEYGVNEYLRSHLPRAMFVDVDEQLSGPLTGTTARHPLPDVHVFIEWCKSMGIGAEKPALCYDDECGGLGACRMWWMLHSLGVEAYVLNGGFQAYSAAGLPLEVGPQKEKPHPAESWPYGTVFVRALAINEVPPNAVMVDARASLRFSTTVRPYTVDTMPGHIDRALNLPWCSSIACKDGLRCLMSEEECRCNVLKALHGVLDESHPDVSNCVFYCGSGVTATFNIALVCHLGFGEPFLYCGSWSEYSGRFAFEMSRRIVEEHGMFFKMLSPSLCDSPKAALGGTVVAVDGTVVKAVDAEVEAALSHMHIGEKARVFFKSGRIAVIEVSCCQ
ncbi:mercaptopyruvate sulfurtransferase [Trypanosoma grayi]|uniref:mercaptopyruvate sulfurtransferase n=1 Tax=Trypanosoma grayi TaxID=71804 RepID=UPI0004F49A7A|nr:mercaptopyruvate sulfurtransferase [Trypanosoma grayi]KEG07899.1 mercaptopyruvate sulfurtransferase [Trypanosoma grayi]